MRQSQSTAAKQSAAQSSVLAALGITLLKLLTGILTGSLGMLSEAAHSFIDLIAAGITLLTVRVADRPADEEHNYGHGKLENLSAAFETVLMVASCVWIAREAIGRIVHHRHLDLRWSVWPFVVLLLSIAVDYTRSRALHRVAQQHRSDALEADAIHFGTDIWSSAAVFFGLLAAFAGARLHISALEYADPVAALVVAAIILRVTWRLARQTVDSLLDATPPEVREQVSRELVRDLAAIGGVLIGGARARAAVGVELFCGSDAEPAAESDVSAVGADYVRGYRGGATIAAGSRCGDPHRADGIAGGERVRSDTCGGGTVESGDSRCERAAA